MAAGKSFDAARPEPVHQESFAVVCGRLVVGSIDAEIHLRGYLSPHVQFPLAGVSRQ